MADLKKEPLIIIAGPTAIGKTALSIELAKRISGEIISADSMQVYRGLDIGSAKIMPREMDGIRHHLIDILEPREPFDVYLFRQLAKEAIRDIRCREKIPIVVGGTGFYIQALLYDVAFTEEKTDPGLRSSLAADAQKYGNDFLHNRLKEIDPYSADEIHPNNIKRVIRAIEYFYLTGERISEHNAKMRHRESPYDFHYFVLNDDREKIYQRIDKRVDKMLSEGLVSEVKGLIASGVRRDMTSMQGIGYREIYDYLENRYPYEEAVRLIKRNTRHFAKRQLTWFKREKDVIWVNIGDYHTTEELLLYIMGVISG